MPEIGYKYNVSNDELNDLIKKANLSDSIAILEKWFCLEGEKPDCFDLLSNITSEFSEWDKGRVFDFDSEIRWEKEGDSYHVLLISDNENIADEWKKESLEFKDEVRKERKILLWGERIINTNKWYEKQIPKIFEYPAIGNGNRAYLLINEYQLPNDSDDSLIFRFKEVITE